MLNELTTKGLDESGHASAEQCSTGRSGNGSQDEILDVIYSFVQDTQLFCLQDNTLGFPILKKQASIQRSEL